MRQVIRRNAAVTVTALALCLCAGRSVAQPMTAADTTDIATSVAEASARFGVPAGWIEQIIRVESAGQTRALSRAGAIGLMQVMPTTYASMRARYGLGANPWSVRDNILAGTAYVRELFNRFGSPGFLAAYNAGPRRWEDHLAGARPLPAETVAYLARLGDSTLSLPTKKGETGSMDAAENRLFAGLTRTGAVAARSPGPSALAEVSATPSARDRLLVKLTSTGSEP